MLYFKFAKWLAWTFAILSLLWLPAITTNSYGGGITEQSTTAWLAATTIGNLGDTANATAVTLPGCEARLEVERTIMWNIRRIYSPRHNDESPSCMALLPGCEAYRAILTQFLVEDVSASYGLEVAANTTTHTHGYVASSARAAITSRSL